MLQPESLYEGFSKEKAKAYRDNAISKYGKEVIVTAEKKLLKMSKVQIEQLKNQQKKVFTELFSLRNEPFDNYRVQAEIASHYKITRQFLGTDGTLNSQAESYSGLGQLYLNDERFTMIDGKPQPGFARFLNNAMAYFANHRLKQ